MTPSTHPHDPHLLNYDHNSALYSTVSRCEAKHSICNLILNEMPRPQWRQFVPLALSVPLASPSSRTRRTDAICCDLPRDARMRVGFYCLKLFPPVPLASSSTSSSSSCLYERHQGQWSGKNVHTRLCGCVCLASMNVRTSNACLWVERVGRSGAGDRADTLQQRAPRLLNPWD